MKLPVKQEKPRHLMTNDELRRAIRETHEIMKGSLRNLQAEMYMEHYKALMQEEIQRATRMVFE